MKADCYYCKKRTDLAVQYEKEEKDGRMRRTVTVYRSNGCSGCPFRKQTASITANAMKTIEVLYVSKKMKRKTSGVIGALLMIMVRSDEPDIRGRGFANIKRIWSWNVFISRNANVTAQKYILRWQSGIT